MLRSPTLQSRTASALNSGVNFLRFLAIEIHSYRTIVRAGVSTETGEDHISAAESGVDRARRPNRESPAMHLDVHKPVCPHGIEDR